MKMLNRYLDGKDRIVEVTQGLGGCWIVGRRNPRTGGHHRVKANCLPPRETAEECQKDLDAYAAKNRWPEMKP